MCPPCQEREWIQQEVCNLISREFCQQLAWILVFRRYQELCPPMKVVQQVSVFFISEPNHAVVFTNIRNLSFQLDMHTCDRHVVFSSVDAFNVPKFNYDPIRKGFYPSTNKLSVHADAAAKTAVYQDRFILLQKRVLRQEAFTKPALGLKRAEDSQTAEVRRTLS
jgi:hypothetical protein